MSDFLGTLLARSLSAPLALPVVQPRLLSRFEPEGAASAAVMTEREAPHTARTDRDASTPRVEPEAPQARPSRTSVALEPEHARAPRPTTAFAEPSPNQRPQVPRTETPTPSASMRPPEALEPEPQRPSTVLPTRTLTRPAAPLTTRVAAPAEAPRVPHQPTSENPIPPASPPPSQATLAVSLPPAQAAHVVPSVTLARAASTAVAEPRAALAPPRAPAEAPAPVIQVTIGRIEVRARESRAGVPRERTVAGPLTSLEDYLARRRREGGGAP
jgi:hypothetical protein